MKTLKTLIVVCSFLSALFSSEASQATPRFTRSEPVTGQPIVTDNATGLVWQGCRSGQKGTQCGEEDSESSPTYTWTDAFPHCTNLVWGGYSDWVLPELKELHSIVDNRVRLPAIDEVAFPATGEGMSFYYWTSSSLACQTRYWYIFFLYGTTGSAISTTDLNHVRCVRRP